jgi:hypothetical protein
LFDVEGVGPGDVGGSTAHSTGWKLYYCLVTSAFCSDVVTEEEEDGIEEVARFEE